jgi:crossover junction endodeoxyribonuclease RusA
MAPRGYPMRSLSLTVLGDPKAQGSKRAILHRSTKRPILIESGGAPLRTWRQDIVAAAQEELNGDGPLEGPVKVSLFFFMRSPKKPKAPLPITRPDADKLCRAVLDALTTAGVMRDDSQVTSLSARKRYGEPPRVVIFATEEG